MRTVSRSAVGYLGGALLVVGACARPSLSRDAASPASALDATTAACWSLLAAAERDTATYYYQRGVGMADSYPEARDRALEDVVRFFTAQAEVRYLRLDTESSRKGETLSERDKKLYMQQVLRGVRKVAECPERIGADRQSQVWMTAGVPRRLLDTLPH